MQSVGFLLKDIDVSQLTYYLTSNIAKLLDERSDIDFIVFQQSLIRPPMKAPFAILHERELWSYTGVAITNTLDLAKNLYAMPQPKKKIFYCCNLDWQSNFDFDLNYKIYNGLDLIAENEHIAQLLENQWAKPLGIAPNFDIRKMLEIICV